MNVDIAKRLQGTTEYFFAQKMEELSWLREQSVDVINLGIGNPDLPPPATMQHELTAAAAQPNVHGYQASRGNRILVDSIARWYKQHFGVDLNTPAEVLPLMGSKEGILHLSMALLGDGDVVLVPNPGYPVYAIAARLAGAQIVEYDMTDEQGFCPNLKALDPNLLKRVKVIWVNYPHMPTGAVGSVELFRELVAFASEHSIVICSDNAYSFILNPNPISILSVEGAKEVAVELNSLSKSYNMAGWRVGMLVGNPHIIGLVERFRSNMESGMPLPVQLAAAAALGMGNEWFVSLNQQYKERKQLAIRLARELDCEVVASHAGLFVWCRIPPYVADSESFSAEILRQTGIFLAPGSVFGSNGERFLRISLCAPVETFASAIRRSWAFEIIR